MMSGVGREFPKSNEFLSMMREAREKVFMQRNEKIAAIRERKEKKLEAGERVVSRAL